MVYPLPFKDFAVQFYDFKTSYVMVYHLLDGLREPCCVISKHLMLWFIFNEIKHIQSFKYFKTSYVMVYLVPPAAYSLHRTISKHLMLWFIAGSMGTVRRIRAISKHLMLWFISTGLHQAFTRVIFQNILCYGLSSFLISAIILSSSFQNILCYGLSQ